MASVIAILTVYEGAYINIRVSVFSMNKKLNRFMITINKLVEYKKKKRERERGRYVLITCMHSALLI